MTAQPVPPELLDSWRDRFECWNRHEFEQMAQMYREDGVYDASAVFIGEAPIRGRQAMLAYWEQMWEVWEGARLDPVRGFDAGEGRYVVEARLGSTGRRSGAETDRDVAFLYTLDDQGLIASARLFRDTEEALAAAGR